MVVPHLSKSQCVMAAFPSACDPVSLSIRIKKSQPVPLWIRPAHADKKVLLGFLRVGDFLVDV